MAKKETKMDEECCLSCANLLTCEDILNYKCKTYGKGAAKSGIATKYAEQIVKVRGLAFDLVAAINNLTVIDAEQAVAEKIQKEPTLEPVTEKPSISKRNKDIIKLVEQGKTAEEIAKELNLKQETLKTELEYLTKNGMIKTPPT